ncbi:MAG: AbrB/MazE/SpoVT family DNA-binding domain-containing protein [Phycisphaerae bacterium]
MNMRITIDKAGQMILPKSVRHALGLAVGDSVLMEPSTSVC